MDADLANPEGFNCQLSIAKLNLSQVSPMNILVKFVVISVNFSEIKFKM